VQRLVWNFRKSFSLILYQEPILRFFKIYSYNASVFTPEKKIFYSKNALCY
jgi:hypothetical protein